MNSSVKRIWSTLWCEYNLKFSSLLQLLHCHDQFCGFLDSKLFLVSSPVPAIDVDDVPSSSGMYSQLTPVIPTSSTKHHRQGEEDQLQVHKFLKSHQYNPAVSESKIQDLSVKHFVENKDRKVKWCVNMYCQWCVQRNKVQGMEKILADIDVIVILTAPNLVFALSRFICEICKLDNTKFPLKTVYDIIIMIQFHLEKLGLHFKLLDGTEFVRLHQVVDNIMKEHSKQDLG